MGLQRNWFFLKYPILAFEKHLLIHINSLLGFLFGGLFRPSGAAAPRPDCPCRAPGSPENTGASSLPAGASRPGAQADFFCPGPKIFFQIGNEYTWRYGPGIERGSPPIAKPEAARRGSDQRKLPQPCSLVVLLGRLPVKARPGPPPFFSFTKSLATVS